MKRETLSGATHSARLGSMSRGTVRKVDHSTTIPTADMDAGRNDSPKGVPIVQPYGFSYWPMSQSEEEGGGQQQGGGSSGSSGNAFEANDQPKGKSAIGLMSYSNGSRSDPSSQGFQDPRHHMMLEDEKEDKQQQGGGSGSGSSSGSGKKKNGGKEGDVALYRTNDKKKIQQMHLTDEGPRLTSVQTQKFALVEAEEEQSGSGGGSSGSSSGGGSQQEDGQRPIFKKESTTYFEQTAKKTTTKRGEGHVTVEDSDIFNYYKDQTISTRVNKDHVHMRFKANRVWVDESGCWTTKPIQVRDDPDSGGSGSSAGAAALGPSGSEVVLRWDSILHDPGRNEIAAVLEKFSGNDINSWVDDNIKTFEQMKDVFKALLKAIART